MQAVCLNYIKNDLKVKILVAVGTYLICCN